MNWLLALWLGVSAAAQQPTNVKDALTDLDQLRHELEAKQGALAELAVQEVSLVDSLGELDEGLARLDDDRHLAEDRLQQLRIDIGMLERSRGIDEGNLSALHARLQARLRALVVDGEGGTARALLGAEGFTELVLRRRFLRELAQNDAKLSADVERLEVAASAHRSELREKLAEQELTNKLIDEQRLLLSTTREEREHTLQRVRDEHTSLKRAADELVSKHRNLQVLIGKLAEGPRYQPPTGKKGILRGTLPWPVDGASIIRKFGSIIDKDTGAEIVSNGIELRAEAGVPIVSVADGLVMHTGWLRGFGRVVIIDHGEGHHTVSAHLSRIAVATGDEVKRGQTIGFVGDTESQNGPKLYFELRENSRPRDPTPFLRR